MPEPTAPRFCVDHAPTPDAWLSAVGQQCADAECGRYVASVDTEKIGAIVCHIVTTQRSSPDEGCTSNPLAE